MDRPAVRVVVRLVVRRVGLVVWRLQTALPIRIFLRMLGEVLLRLLQLRRRVLLVVVLLPLPMLLLLVLLHIDFHHFPVLPFPLPLSVPVIPVHVGGFVFHRRMRNAWIGERRRDWRDARRAQGFSRMRVG